MHPKRPLLVWIILILSILASLSVLLSSFIGSILPAEITSSPEWQEATTHIKEGKYQIIKYLSYANVIVSLYAAIMLFRLKTQAVYGWLVSVAITFISLALTVFLGYGQYVTTGNIIMSMIFPFLIFMYSVKLNKSGVLR